MTHQAKSRGAPANQVPESCREARLGIQGGLEAKFLRLRNSRDQVVGIHVGARDDLDMGKILAGIGPGGGEESPVGTQAVDIAKTFNEMVSPDRRIGGLECDACYENIAARVDLHVRYGYWSWSGSIPGPGFYLVFLGKRFGPRFDRSPGSLRPGCLGIVGNAALVTPAVAVLKGIQAAQGAEEGKEPAVLPARPHGDGARPADAGIELDVNDFIWRSDERDCDVETQQPLRAITPVHHLIFNLSVSGRDDELVQPELTLVVMFGIPKSVSQGVFVAHIGPNWQRQGQVVKPSLATYQDRQPADKKAAAPLEAGEGIAKLSNIASQADGDIGGSSLGNFHCEGDVDQFGWLKHDRCLGCGIGRNQRTLLKCLKESIPRKDDQVMGTGGKPFQNKRTISGGQRLGTTCSYQDAR